MYFRYLLNILLVRVPVDCVARGRRELGRMKDSEEGGVEEGLIIQSDWVGNR